VDEKIEDGERVIIICTFTEEINELKKYYGNKCVVYDGKMSLKQKDKAEYEFMNNPKVKVFIGQIIACSVGLTLTAAHTLVFNSYSWVAADNLQAQDRIYRLNQTQDVTCIYQLFNDSISQNMFDKVMRKEVIMNETIKSENEK
jgi:SNF2 family DNA or RNA helicase